MSRPRRVVFLVGAAATVIAEAGWLGLAARAADGGEHRALMDKNLGVTLSRPVEVTVYRKDSKGARTSESSGVTRPPRGIVLSIGTFVVFGGLCLASLVFRPIQAIVVFGAGALALAVLARCSQRATARRRWCTSAALGIVSVLAFYGGSALLNMEPDQVVEHGSSPVIHPERLGPAEPTV